MHRREHEGSRLRWSARGATLVLATLVLGAAGCGGEPSDRGTAERGTGEAALDWARCMRKHGADVPDPQTDETGRLVIVGARHEQNRRDRAYERALAGCRELFDQARPAGAREVSAEERDRFLEGALRFVRCLRKQGVDMPDPVVDSREVSLRLPPNANLESPAFRRAQQACERLMPSSVG